MNISELRQLCQATAPAPKNESLLGRFCRIFSIYFTYLFLKTPVTPNQITALSAAVFFIGISLFFFSNYLLDIAASCAVIISVMLDGADGEVSRYRKNTRISGKAYAEPVSHDIQYGLMFFLLGLVLWSRGGSPLFIALGAFAGIVKLLFRMLEVRFWYGFIQPYTSDEEVEKKKYAHKKKRAFVRLFYWLNKNVYSSAALGGPLLVFAILKRLDLFLWLYAIGFTIFFLLLFIKQTREIYIKKL